MRPIGRKCAPITKTQQPARPEARTGARSLPPRATRNSRTVPGIDDLKADRVKRLMSRVATISCSRRVRRGAQRLRNHIRRAGSFKTRSVRGSFVAYILEHTSAECLVTAALRTLHEALPVDECPFNWGVPARIRNAREHGITLDIPEPPPVDRLVVCHGDPCCPNTFSPMTVRPLGTSTGRTRPRRSLGRHRRGCNEHRVELQPRPARHPHRRLRNPPRRTPSRLLPGHLERHLITNLAGEAITQTCKGAARPRDDATRLK